MLSPSLSLESQPEPILPELAEPTTAHESDRLKWIQVRELPSGEFVGEFRLECSGIMRARSKAEQEAAERIPAQQDQMLRSILSVLKPEDTVEFCFYGGGGEALQWGIRGKASRETADEARESAADLLPSFRALTSALGEQYRFEPRAFGQEGEGNGFASILTTETATLLLPDGGQLGFSSDSSQRPGLPRVVVPIFQPKKSFTFPSLAAAITGSPSPVRCLVSLSPFKLTRSQTQLLKRAVEHVFNQIESRKSSPSSSAGIDQSLAGCWEALSSWSSSRAGYQIRAELLSAAPISPGLRGLITNDLFPSNSAAQEGSNTPLAVLEESSLDLTNSIPTRGTLPILFPDLRTLERQDLTQLYNRKRPKLAATGLRLGHIDEGNLQMSVNADPDFRDRHIYIIGGTGTGKSNFLSTGIRQDTFSGRGLCLIDPHGDLYQQTLEAIPASRVNDVILINPCETDAVPGINFLEVTSEKTRGFEVNYAINELVKMLERMYDMRTAGGPMFETYFRNALILLVDSRVGGYTLAELPVVFEDKEFREHLKKNCNNPYAVNFWNRQAEKAGGEASLQNIAPYITSKLNLLIQSALLRPIIGQSRSTINFREIMDRRKILLVNLSKGQLGELDMQLLGMIIIGKIFSAAMSRSTVGHEQRVPFHLYVDEFQNFTTDTAASLLSEARKFGLCLTLANQNLAQLNTNQGKQNLFDAVLGNVGSFILFRLGAPDAEKMEVYTRPHFNHEDLQNLPNFHALGRLQTARGPSIPFVFKTEPAAAVRQSKGVLNAIRKRQRLYRSPRELVEKMILDRQNVTVASLGNAEALAKLRLLDRQRSSGEAEKENAEHVRLREARRAAKVNSELSAASSNEQSRGVPVVTHRAPGVNRAAATTATAKGTHQTSKRPDRPRKAKQKR